MILLYDDRCSLCTAWKRWLEWRDRRGVFKLIGCHSEAARAACPQVAQADCAEELKLVLDDGRVLGGFYAVREILSRLPGYRSLSAFARWRLLEGLFVKLYRSLARNRNLVNFLLRSYR